MPSFKFLFFFLALIGILSFATFSARAAVLRGAMEPYDGEDTVEVPISVLKKWTDFKRSY
ncbi:unnamed protein product [Hymenolepis diminuta]|uniref:Uncharacterized protein n=1 Tax=Hymenolepis diminuta TaxID=6216 RepID=A0A564YB70_HYMDI|nr:unnamed protein product [Hymenolepis diminuta]